MDETKVRESESSSGLQCKADPWRVINRPPNAVLFGLCAITSNVYCTRPIEAAQMDVVCNGASTTVPAESVARAVGDGLWSLLANVNTHTLANGPLRIEFALVWPDGVRAQLGAFVSSIENHGELATTVRDGLQNAHAPAVFGRVIDSTLFPYAEAAKAWFDDDAPAVPLSSEPAPDAETAKLHLWRWGFTVLNESIPLDMVQRFNIEVDEAIAAGKLKYRPGTSDRILDAHRLPTGREIWLYPPVLKFLRDWFRDEPCACQTLLYINGSEQNGHQDTIHLTPFPAGYMSGVWVALEDIQPDSGELFVYPGSHRLPRLRATELGLAKVSTDYSSYAKFDATIAELIREAGIEPIKYRPKAGQILVWHENLVHGGARRVNPSITRRSIVSHYFPAGSVAYYDSRGEAASLERVSEA